MVEHRHHDENASDSHLDLCMYCGGTILRGALRCVSCGKILKTPEEQSAAVREIMKNRTALRIRKIMKTVSFLILSGAAYYFFSDAVNEFLSALLGK